VKNTAISGVEIENFKWVLVCIYRSPHSDVHIFLKKLELLIDRMHKKKKRLIICGNCNVNLLQENEHIQTLKNILASCGLINKFTSPTRVASSLESLLDVMVINIEFNKNYLEVVNMGYSDHLVQILWVSIEKGNKEGKKVLQRKYTKENVDKFITMLINESWEEIYVEKSVNEIYKQFINTFLDYFNKIFPLELLIRRDVKNKTWILKAIKMSCQKMRFLNNLKQDSSVKGYSKLYK
jgi:hypothetical protein